MIKSYCGRGSESLLGNSLPRFFGPTELRVATPVNPKLPSLPMRVNWVWRNISFPDSFNARLKKRVQNDSGNEIGSTWASSTRGRLSAEIYYMIAKTFTYRELPLNLLIFLRAVLLLSTIVVVSHQSVFRHRSMVENYIAGSVQSYMGTRVGHVGKLEQHQA